MDSDRDVGDSLASLSAEDPKRRLGLTRDAWQLDHIDWGVGAGLIQVETADGYRAEVASGARRDDLLSWIKFDGDPDKIGAYIKARSENERDVGISLAELCLRSPKVTPGDAEARRIVRNVRRGYHLAGVPLAASLLPDDPRRKTRTTRHRASPARRSVTRSRARSPGRPSRSDDPDLPHVAARRQGGRR